MGESCHGTSFLKADLAGKRKIAIVGNPNVGKSIFFGYFSGQFTVVSNYPGTTIDLSTAKWRDYTVIDTPGIYSVSSANDEERVARDIILEADVIINIVDAVRLERDLFVTKQLIDMAKPVIVALNFMDEVKRCGLSVDHKKLSDILGVTVIPTIAKTGVGLKELEDNIDKITPSCVPSDILEQLQEFMVYTNSYQDALLILEGDTEILNRFKVEDPLKKDSIYNSRRKFVNYAVNEVVKEEDSKISLGQRIGSLCVNPLSGSFILLGVLALLYYFVGVLIAGDLVGITEEQIMGGYWTPFVQEQLARLINKDNFLYVILAGDTANNFDGGDYGLLTMTITYLIGLLLPLVVGFYIMLSLLEDSGYLPRLATLVDRFLNKIGLNGRAVIPIILGFGCVQLGTITTRLLGSDREKRIAASILNFTIPCSAQLGVITVMLSGIGLFPVLLYIGVMFFMFAFVGTVLNRILPGQSLPLIMDLPPLRLPSVKNVLKKVFYRSYFFLKEASPWFFLGAFIVSILQVTGGLNLWQRLWSPITESWLNLPGEASKAFIMGMVRRDFGAAGLLDLDLSPYQTVVSLVVITLFVPCIASFMILMKERGWKEGIVIWLGSLTLAFLVGGILAQVITYIALIFS